MIELPIRLDRAQEVLFRVFSEEVTPSVAWAYGAPSFDTVPEVHVNLEPFGGPTARTRRSARGRVYIPIESIDVRVTSASAGLLPIIGLNGFNFKTETVGGDSLSSIRDRLIDSINADENEQVAAEIVDADTLRLEAETFGAIRSLRFSGPLEWSNAIDQSPAVLIEGSSTLLVRVQIFTKATELWRGATAIMSKLEATLQTPDIRERLREYGVTVVDIGTPVDISTMAGSRWESRSETILTLALWASWARPTNVIESVSATQIARDLTGAQVESRTYQIGV